MIQDYYGETNLRLQIHQSAKNNQEGDLNPENKRNIPLGYYKASTVHVRRT